MCVCGGAVLVLLLCLIVYYIKDMYECVHVFVLHCVIVLNRPDITVPVDWA